MDEAGLGDWSGRSRGGGFGHRFFIFLVRRAGIGFAYGFLALVVVYFIPFAPRATRAAWFYNRRILGYGILRAAAGLFAQYYRFGQTLIDKIAIAAGMADKFNFEFDDYPRFLEILDSGSGVVMIGAHVGCWEAGARFFGDYARRMNIVHYDAEAASVKRALERNAAPTGYKTIAVGDDGLENILRVKRALDAGEYVCFQGDRYVPGSHTLEAVFMGRSAKFPAGPFTIGARMGVPMVFYYSMRGKGRSYRFSFVRAEARTRQELLDEYLAATERTVRAHPTQWFNFYRFWTKTK